MELESSLQIDDKSPVEIFYYQQVSEDPNELFVTPWGGVLVKNHDVDGNLLEFQNIDDFELSFRRTRKHLWLFLKLKIFIDNGRVYGFFICPECPSMSGLEQLKSPQNPESIKQKLCTHSRTVTIKIQDWRRYWTVSTSQPREFLGVIPSDESTQKIFVPMFSKKPFVACTFNQGDVCILYCVSNRQANPFCSVCTGRKCRHFSLLAASQSESGVRNTRLIDDLESYYPKYDKEEEDIEYNDHYLIKPPRHVRGYLYGYNFKDVVFPFSDSSSQQQVWMQRMNGVINLPDQLVPVYNSDLRCKHDNSFDSKELYLEAKNLCLYTDLGERIFSSAVYARVSVGACNCLQRVDGHKFLIWNLGKGEHL